MVNEYNSDGETALQVAVRYQAELMPIQIDAKADVNVEDKDKNTPLHWIARNGQSDIIGKVIESETNLEAKNKESQTPLHWAMKYGNLTTVRKLIKEIPKEERSAAMHEIDHKGKVPIGYATER
jgi:ankyrin repeat protein